MAIKRESVITLASLGAAALVATAAGRVEAAGPLSIGLALVGSWADATFGHLGLELVHSFSRRYGEATARARENRDLHRLIGETIAHVLDESASSAAHRFG